MWHFSNSSIPFPSPQREDHCKEREERRSAAEGKGEKFALKPLQETVIKKFQGALTMRGDERMKWGVERVYLKLNLAGF